MAGSGKRSAPENPAVLDKSTATTDEYMVLLLLYTTAVGILNLAVQVRFLERRSNYILFPNSRLCRRRRQSLWPLRLSWTGPSRSRRQPGSVASG